MANGLYVNYQNLILGNGVHTLIDWDSDTVKAGLIDSADYTPNLATHQDIADVPSGGRVAVATITGIVVSGGTVDGDDVTFPSVTGDQAEYLLYWKDTGTEANDTLGAFLDTFLAGMPVTPNGGDIDLVFAAEGILGF